MESHGEPTPNKKKEKTQPKKRNSEQAKKDPSKDGRTYVIYRLNIGEAANKSEGESK